LVVECRKCGTRFQLDPARIPDAGIRVRCSRCKHAFFLKHPDHSDADGVAAVVDRAVRSASPPTPEATRDLSPSSPADSAGAQTVAAPDDEEDDWEFNEDLPSYDDEEECEDPPPESEAPEPAGESQPGEEMSAYDLMSSSMSVDAVEDSPFDLAAAFADSTDSASTVASPAGTDGDSMPETLQGVREVAFGELEDFSHLEEPHEAAPVEVAAPATEEPNIEEPENWDFFGDDGPRQDAPCTPADPFGAALPEAAYQAREDALAEAVSPQDWPDFGQDNPASAAARITNVLGWVVVCSLMGLGVALGLRDTFDPGVRAPSFVPIGEMRAANVKGQWVETAGMGTLYVVSGDLLNPGTRTLIPGLVIEVELMDDAGPLGQRPRAIAGRAIEFDVLRTLPAGDLATVQAAAMQELARGEIPGGASTRFTAVFEALPDEATRFQLRAGAIEAPAPSGSTQAGEIDGGVEPSAKDRAVDA